MPANFYPTRADLSTPERAERVLQMVYDRLYTLERQDTLNLATARSQVTKLQRRLSSSNIQRELSAVGAAPLNVEGLLGVLAMPQKAGVPTVTALPDVLLSQDGELVSLNNIIYRFDATTEPGTWTAARAQATVVQDTYANRPAATTADNGRLFHATDQNVLWIVKAGAWAWLAGLMEGTLSPNQKPTLVAGDVGFLFRSTDFNHTYRWSGTVWAQVDDIEPGTIIFTTIAPVGAGWQLCDGTVGVTRSTVTGGTTTVTVPDYSIAAYMKVATVLATGPTAASGTVALNSPGITVDAHTTVAVQSGAGTTVLSGPLTHTLTNDPHNHGPGTLELRRTTLLAYYRL